MILIIPQAGNAGHIDFTILIKKKTHKNKNQSLKSYS